MLFTILEIPIPDIMKIILIGNIGVGKTTIARKLLEKYKEADFVSIDDMAMDQLRKRIIVKKDLLKQLISRQKYKS